MRVSRQGYESRTDSVRDLRCGQRTTSSAAAAWKCRERAAPIFIDRPSPTSAVRATRQTDQEQIQMIATAIGIPKPSAPKIARTNSESRLTWCRTPDDVMTLLLGAPRATARPQDELSIAPLDRGPRRLSVIKQCWAVMVNKRLMGIKRGLQTAPCGAPLDREACAGAAHVVQPKFRNSASPVLPAVPPASPR